MKKTSAIFGVSLALTQLFLATPLTFGETSDTEINTVTLRAFGTAGEQIGYLEYITLNRSIQGLNAADTEKIERVRDIIARQNMRALEAEKLTNQIAIAKIDAIQKVNEKGITAQAQLLAAAGNMRDTMTVLRDEVLTLRTAIRSDALATAAARDAALAVVEEQINLHLAQEHAP